MKNPLHICILGGGFGGLYTAIYLQHFLLFKSPNCKITLVDRNDRLTFTPLLYELVTDELQAWEIGPDYQKILSDRNVNFCQGIVEGVDLEKRQVKLKKNSDNREELLTYDYLVLAVGVQMRLEGVPGAATYAYTFRTIADAERLKQRLKILENTASKIIQVAVVGGGPSGVELACKLADRLGKRGQVRLIERGNELLKTFSPYSRKSAIKALKARRIEVDFDTSIEAVESDKILIFQNGERSYSPVDLVLWTVGNRSIDWVRNLPCQQNDRGQLLTLPTLQLVDYPEVLALGDLAEIQYHPQKQLPATAQVAYQQASCAAKNLYLAARGKRLQKFRYLHLGEMLTLGKGAAVVSSFALKVDGGLAGGIRQFVYLQRLPTLRHQLRVLRHWIGKWLRGLKGGGS
ncbi:MAG TPA: NAD(P)/FAD-dependent oxidoreductase [Cyanobacteria bacterium UBA11149]|nr:NAD(P)/FAD-dependent oxidoreductase [Cyanobacteria bacterium UBA11367]HBE59241.1 NAD(P)/FAD-dependent oxidoreductase [Cyanobacteria bacterium UBA11366]HBK62933.1 NAD(P)/FAD-dependent oxidoreductase [Cyanobacteria bacterium UBA11166]HBR76869.1 NAD(P)/FAD-dependent oxidoreductase [Cyanobacteria bacterium UBA11159]HBS69132.1 NAD(P)/FAD-dependent oxidoreductase [Cyanobacteria bacterium UBA11153]HBW88267.1 NAD(P)/FAD-dependent oxidoreductase [Cyanobacteria bacterium UBA11149]